jgi:hypothetical protein
MRSLITVVAISLVASPLAAQTAVQLTAGLTSSGTLVTDGVLRKTLQPAIAPTVGIVFAIPTGKRYRALFEVHYSSSSLRVTDIDLNTTSDYGSLATIDALLMAEGPLAGSLRWQVGGGAIFYRPSASQGVFLDGPVQRWLVAGGVTWTHMVSPRMRLLVQGRVDSHTFTTDILVARDYAGSEGVRRIGLHIGMERVF